MPKNEQAGVAPINKVFDLETARVLGMENAAKVSGYSIRHISRLVQDGALPVTKIGGKSIFNGDDIRRLRAERKGE